MAGGEKSKSSGELGEKIAKNLLGMLGWQEKIESLSIDCVYLDGHKKEGTKKRISHGIDILYQYECPLIDEVQQDIVVSVKHIKKYPTNPTLIFKEHQKELAYTIKCYKKSKYLTYKVSDMVRRRNVIGVLIWLSNVKEDQNRSLLNELSSIRNSPDVDFDVIYLVDSKRSNNLFHSNRFINTEYRDSNIEFYYIDSGHNSEALKRQYSGAVFPVQYFASNIIPYKIEKNGIKTLALTVAEEFEKENLIKILGLAQVLVQDWCNEIVICYQDYDEYNHKSIVQEAKSQFRNSQLIRESKVRNYNPNVKSLGE